MSTGPSRTLSLTHAGRLALARSRTPEWRTDHGDACCCFACVMVRIARRQLIEQAATRSAS